jgi:hypothetical protein
MKYAVTGTSQGLGKYLAERYNAQCFTRDLGYDITTKKGRQQIVEDADFDVFINSARFGFSQTELLYDLYDKFKNEDKLIVSIGSCAKEYYFRDVPYKYGIEKLALNEASKQLSVLETPLKFVCLNFGYLENKGGDVTFEQVGDFIDSHVELSKKYRLIESLLRY